MLKKYRILFVASILVGMLLAWYWLRPSNGDVLRKGPMVQNVGPDRFTVVWETSPAVPSDIVLTREVKGASRTGTLIESKGTRHAVEFGGLQPHSEYQYRLTVGVDRVLEHTVRTAPGANDAYRFVAFGDSGDGSAAQFIIADRIREANPDLIIHTGDLVYPGGDESHYPAKFYKPNAAFIAEVPFYPCPGNHDFSADLAQPMFDEFVLPRNGPEGQTPERHYWFDFGPARFVSIDSNQTLETLGQVVAPWLDQVLVDAGDRWKFVFLHHPAYTDGKYEPTYRLRSTILPVMEARGVTLLLTGHDHMYQRSRPIRDGQVTEDGQGIVHIVTAAGGAELYERRPDPSPLFAVINNQVCSFTVVDVTVDELFISQIDATGKTLDEFSLTRPSPVDAPSDAPDKPLDGSALLPQTP